MRNYRDAEEKELSEQDQWFHNLQLLLEKDEDHNENYFEVQLHDHGIVRIDHKCCH